MHTDGGVKSTLPTHLLSEKRDWEFEPGTAFQLLLEIEVEGKIVPFRLVAAGFGFVGIVRRRESGADAVFPGQIQRW